MGQESSIPVGLADQFPTFDVEENVYTTERRKSDSLPHRKHDLARIFHKKHKPRVSADEWHV